jgi:hypothetical protein
MLAKYVSAAGKVRDVCAHPNQVVARDPTNGGFVKVMLNIRAYKPFYVRREGS